MAVPWSIWERVANRVSSVTSPSLQVLFVAFVRPFFFFGDDWCGGPRGLLLRLARFDPSGGRKLGAVKCLGARKNPEREIARMVEQGWWRFQGSICFLDPQNSVENG